MLKLFLVVIFYLQVNFLYSLYASDIGLVRQKGYLFEQFEKTIVEILGSQYKVHTFVLEDHMKYSSFLSFVRSKRLKMLVLMDNAAVKFGKRLSFESDKNLSDLPSVSAMGLNLKEQLRGFRSMSGVAYEVPALTNLINFRNLLKDKKLTNVLTVYRHSVFSNMMRDAQMQLNREGINLIGLDASSLRGDELTFFLERYLSDLYYGNKIDAVLVMADNVLISRENFSTVWINKARSLNIPFICGVKSLVAEDLDFCSYASYPDHVELANQVSQQIFSIIEEGANPEELGVEYILSVKEVVNLPLLKSKSVLLNDSVISNLDK